MVRGTDKTTREKRRQMENAEQGTQRQEETQQSECNSLAPGRRKENPEEREDTYCTLLENTNQCDQRCGTEFFCTDSLSVINHTRDLSACVPTNSTCISDRQSSCYFLAWSFIMSWVFLKKKKHFSAPKAKYFTGTAKMKRSSVVTSSQQPPTTPIKPTFS